MFFVSTMDLELNLIFLKGIKFGFAKKEKSILNGNEVTEVFFVKKFSSPKEYLGL